MHSLNAAEMHCPRPRPSPSPCYPALPPTHPHTRHAHTKNDPLVLRPSAAGAPVPADAPFEPTYLLARLPVAGEDELQQVGGPLALQSLPHSLLPPQPCRR
jgi:hypothetical protein